MFGDFKKSRTFATAIERESDKKLNGALVHFFCSYLSRLRLQR